MIASVVISGCAKSNEGVESPEVESVSVALDRPLDANLAGLVTGMASGAFEDAGLDVEVTVADEPGGAVREVAAGRAELAISDGPQVILGRDQGLDVIATGAVVDRTISSLIWLPRSRIRGPADLRGKSIALADRPYIEAFLESILTRAGVPEASIQVLRAPEGLAPALFTGRADATLGGSRNVEGVKLVVRGRSPTAIPVDELGIPAHDEIVVVANAAELENGAGDGGETVRLFLAALERGTAAAAADPAAAARDLIEVDPGLTPEAALESVEASLPLLETSAPEQPFGWMDRERWQDLIAWMRDSELIGSLPEAGEVISDRYLPAGPPEDG